MLCVHQKREHFENDDDDGDDESRFEYGGYQIGLDGPKFAERTVHVAVVVPGAGQCVWNAEAKPF